ncbi:hypothetical protein HHK36_021495 [Tetracentron sinense]|uniref:Protein kinase domain-containing protein n=1 Tax=Tetracentron sinense TaxID=13715 RepID=A0A834YPU4_TETSI|nr:hypothetical protein HHK36_021495 [Tetracentron sinense]
MKEPSLLRRRRPPSVQKIKLLCSFNGVFQPKQSSGKLRYVGGETRIISVDRNIGILRFRSKISELCPQTRSFSLKYQLPESDDIDGDAPLVLVSTDDDVRCMIDEYDKLEANGKPARLWVFVCDYNGYVGRNTDYCCTGFCSEIENSNLGSGVLRTVSGLGDSVYVNALKTEKPVTHVCGVQNSGNFFSLNTVETKIPGTQVAGIRHRDDSVQKMVLEQQVLATQVAGFQSSSHGFSTLKPSHPHIPSTCFPRNPNSDHCGRELASEPQGFSTLKPSYPQIPFTCFPRNPLSDQCGRELASERQPLTNHNSPIQSFGDSYGVNTSDNKIPYTHVLESQNFCSLIPFPESHMGHLNSNGGNLQVETSSFMKFPSGISNEVLAYGESRLNAGRSGQPVAAAAQISKQARNPRASISGSVKQGLRNIEHVSMRNFNRENVVPWTAYCDSVETCLAPLSCSNQLAGKVSPLKSSFARNRAWDNPQSGLRNHRFGVSDTRNQRISSYHIRNHRNNPPEMVNNRFDRRSCVGKCYPGLKPSSNISKHGQAMRLYHPYFWKPWSGVHENIQEGMARMRESSKDSQPSSSNLKNSRGILREHVVQPIDGRYPVNHVSRPGGLTVKEFGNSNPQGNHFGYHGECHGQGYHSLLPCNVIKSTIPCVREVTSPENLLNNSTHAKHEVPTLAIFNNIQGVPEVSSYNPLNIKPSCCDLSKEPSLMVPQNIDPPYMGGAELGYKNRHSLFNMKFGPDLGAGVKALNNHHSGVHTLSGGVASSVNLSLYNLSLLSSKEVKPPELSSLAISDVSEALPRCEIVPQPKPLDLMDEGHFSSGPLIKTSKSSSENAAKFGKDLIHVHRENQQDTPSSLSIDEKAEVKGSHTCSKVDGRISSDQAAFYTHLATQELQTIKNSDLEDIRELGSGTYGTVFHGKWKGSDVAIKRIKPSCFTGSELGEDRLIADFWKEAHILGQLHHPNVLAFYGVVTDGPVTNLATVTEYMVNGSLKQVLRRKDRTIDRRKRLIIAMDAAFGMEYLHEKNIVHFDLKSHNFLVNMKDPQRPVCKIGDLGLSKIKQKTLVSGGVRGTIPWMAPELLTSKNMVTEKVDVYSFGIVMWELLTGEEPYAGLRSEEIIVGIIKGDLQPEVPSWCDPAWRSLMERCWSSDPDSRPAFTEIAKELRAMSSAMNIK